MEFQENNLSFIDICRLCLVNPGIVLIDEQLKPNIFVCTGVEVFASNSLPSKICATCYEIVHKAIDFREAVGRNDTLLKSLYKEVDDEGLIEYQIVLKEENEDDNLETESDFIAADTQIDDSNSTQNYTYSCIVNLTSTSTPLGTLTIRKDLFSSSEQNVQKTRKENINRGNEDKIERTKDEDVDEDEDDQVKCEEIDEDELNCEMKIETKAKCEEKDLIVYKCADCSKTFKTRRKLYHHMRQHTKTKPCPIKKCGKMFSSKSDLEKHIRVHTGVKPYKCNLCDKKFTQKCSMISHKEAVH